MFLKIRYIYILRGEDRKNELSGSSFIHLFSLNLSHWDYIPFQPQK